MFKIANICVILGAFSLTVTHNKSSIDEWWWGDNMDDSVQFWVKDRINQFDSSV